VEQQVLGWIQQYGYIVIFGLLMSGIVGLPVPDEFLLASCGILIFRGRLSWPLTFVSAVLGSGCGITLSYILGRTFGLGLIHRYGRYLRITEDHVQKAHAWFSKIGHWALTFGYFIAGVRHFTAYAAGMSEVEWPQFALFAYSGAVIWVATFLSLGYFLGERWKAVEANFQHYLLWAGVVCAVAGVGYLAWRKWGRKG